MISNYRIGKTAHFVIDRPEKKNALTRDMYEDITGYVREANLDKGVHAVVISGVGGVFTAGNDLDDFRARAADENPRPSAGLALIEALMECDTPVLAAVEGLAIGIGTTILLHCDGVFAGRSSKFKTAFVDLGLVPEAASTVTMPLHLGARMSTELLLFGETLNGDQASECGLISRVVDDGQALDSALKLAVGLGEKSRDALRATKSLMKAPWRDQARQALGRERELFGERLRSSDFLNSLNRLQRR